MYKVLIIDDEEPMRQAVRILGDWDKLNISSIIEANDGSSGLEIIRKQSPDIVLIDMKMPIMGGVEFLKIASEEFPKIKYIVISGFDDFEYTRPAINAQVVDYILKPIGRNKLNHALEKAINYLNTEKESQEKRIIKGIKDNISKPIVKERIFSKIIRETPSEQLMDGYLEILDLHNSGLVYGIVLMQIINFNKVSKDKFSGDDSCLYFAITNALDELVEPIGKSFSFRNDRREHEIIAVVTINDKISDIRYRLSIEISKILVKLEECFDTIVIASIGDFYPDLKLISGSYKNAEKILYSVNLLSSVNKVFISFEAEKIKPMISINEKKDILFHSFKIVNLNYAKTIMDNYFKEVIEQGYFSVEYGIRIIVEFGIILEDLVSYMGSKPDEEIHSIIKSDKFNTPINSLEFLKEIMTECILNLFYKININTKTSENKYIYQIKEYIDKNYFCEINLDYFSDKYYMSKEYLSRLFKEEFGFGIYEYTLKIRMENAKVMLDANMKIKDISNALGYKDNNYFSKAFKSYHGISPTEYRGKKSS